MWESQVTKVPGMDDPLRDTEANLKLNISDGVWLNQFMGDNLMRNISYVSSNIHFSTLKMLEQMILKDLKL